VIAIFTLWKLAMGGMEDEISGDEDKVACQATEYFDILFGVGFLVADAVDNEIPLRFCTCNCVFKRSWVVPIGNQADDPSGEWSLTARDCPNPVAVGHRSLRKGTTDEPTAADDKNVDGF
jgi:hypothetical protein